MAIRQDVVAESPADPRHPAPLGKPTRTRWWILIVISVMYLICYMDRSNISVAQPEIARQFHLGKSAMGVVLAASTWAYALGQVPAGWLGDRFGAKRVLTVIMTWWSAAAMMTGAAAGLGSLFGARFLLGIGEASAWTPIDNAFEYDPVNDSWKALAPMPVKRGAAVAATVGDKMT